MRSIEDTVTVMITAVTKRIANTTTQQAQPNLIPQQISTLRGQREAGEVVLNDLVTLLEGLEAAQGVTVLDGYIAATLLKWRKNAIDALTTAFTAYKYAAVMPFANRYYTALAQTYAIVTDELSNAVANREKYEPLATPEQQAFKEKPLAC